MCFDHFTLTVSQLTTYIDSTYGLCLKTRSCWGKWWSYLKAACVYMQGLNLSLLGLLVGINRGNSPHNLNLIIFNSSYISCPQFRLVTQPPRHELRSNDIIQTAVGSSRVGRNVHVSLKRLHEYLTVSPTSPQRCHQTDASVSAKSPSLAVS